MQLRHRLSVESLETGPGKIDNAHQNTPFDAPSVRNIAQSTYSAVIIKVMVSLLSYKATRNVPIPAVQNSLSSGLGLYLLKN